MSTSRAPVMKADISVLTELPSSGGRRVKVRAKATLERTGDAHPVAGFFVIRRYDGDEFHLNDWKQFSSRWMEFVDEPPQEWLDAMDLNEKEKAALMAKQREEEKNSTGEAMVFAMSQALGRMMGRPPTEFDHSSGRFKDPSAGDHKATGEAI